MAQHPSASPEKLRNLKVKRPSFGESRTIHRAPSQLGKTGQRKAPKCGHRLGLGVTCDKVKGHSGGHRGGRD